MLRYRILVCCIPRTESTGIVTPSDAKVTGGPRLKFFGEHGDAPLRDTGRRIAQSRFHFTEEERRRRESNPRLRDVTGLTWEAVDPGAGTLTLTVRKTGAEMVIPLHAEVAEWLATQTRGIGKAPLFPSLANVKSTGGRHGLSGQFNSVMEAAGIRGRTIRAAREGCAGRTTSSLSFHSLRHSFVSSLANAGVAAELRQKLSRHADDRSHAKYTHHALETLRDAVALMPRFSAPAKRRQGAK